MEFITWLFRQEKTKALIPDKFKEKKLVQG